jgi:hypothetical protein
MRQRRARPRWSPFGVGVAVTLVVTLPFVAMLAFEVGVRHVPLGQAACVRAFLMSTVIGALLGVAVYTGLLLLPPRSRPRV